MSTRVATDDTLKDLVIAANAIAEKIDPTIASKRFGFRRKKAESSPSARIEYLYDAVGMNPAHMDFTNGVFDWGDWKEFVEQIARPVMLKLDGTVDYELDHEDQTKRDDGGTSDISNTAYQGNAMVEFGSAFRYVKRYEDATYEYVIFSNKPIDNGYHAYAHTGADGAVKSAFYLGMFTSQKVGNVLHSFGVNNSSVSQNADAEISQSKANGNGYNIMDHMKWSYVLDLLVLIGKSDNLQATYGEGNSGTSAQIANGTLKDKGAFFGYSTTASAVKVLWIENLWGNIWQRMHGLICDNGTYKTKTHAPFCDTPVSAANFSTYRNTGITAPATGYIKDAYCTDADAYLPKTAGGSATTYFCDYFYINATIVAFALVGGRWADGGVCGRCVYLAAGASNAASHFGSRLSQTP